eukprot:TRINITY_DN829_c0_g1_i2.p1 TRINITY_DN829_c0_g1~~TRINITY_DN829_c0_g1_i2.p1  ORF type:complete len:675 (-),score=144.38 TRINITY_DN829_c0_g1_i2:43-2067(-)
MEEDADSQQLLAETAEIAVVEQSLRSRGAEVDQSLLQDIYQQAKETGADFADCAEQVFLPQSAPVETPAPPSAQAQPSPPLFMSQPPPRQAHRLFTKSVKLPSKRQTRWGGTSIYDRIPQPDSGTIPEPSSASELAGQVFSFIVAGDRSAADVDAQVAQRRLEDLNAPAAPHNMPLLMAAVLRGNEEVVSWLISRGADVDARLPCGAPVVTAALRMGEDPAMDEMLSSTVPAAQRAAVMTKARLSAPLMVRALLRKGANPELRDERGRDCNDIYRSRKNCQMLTGYWVQRAIDKKIYSPRVKEFYGKANAQGLGEIFFSLIGQTIAVDLLERRVFSKLCNSRDYRKKPLVAFLAGPPGAGKSQIAEDLAEAISPGHWYRDVFSSVDQGMACSHLFGAEAGFIGSDKDAALPGWIRAHHGKRAVVILEEFEKLDTNALTNLLVPFENGEWPVHSMAANSLSKVDVSGFIFLLTSNLRNQEIIDWCNQSDVMAVVTDPQLTDEDRALKMKKVSRSVFEIIRQHYVHTSVKEFTRRIDLVVPFLTLSDAEQYALIEHLETVRAARHVDPPRGDQKWGGVEVVFTQEFTQQVKQEYDSLAGASSFLRVLDETMDEVLDVVRKSDVPPRKVWTVVADGETGVRTSDPSVCAGACAPHTATPLGSKGFACTSKPANEGSL